MRETIATTTHGRGRAVPVQPEITLRGVPVRLQRVGGSTLQAIQAAVHAEWRDSGDPTQQEPRPPIITAGEITEPNHADPDYLEARRAWEARRNMATGHRVMEYVALEVIEPVDGVDLEAVTQLRRGLARVGAASRHDGLTQYTSEERDRLVYILDILIDQADRAETRLLMQWIYGGQAPTEAEVSDALASFRGELRGPAAPGGDPTPSAGRGDHGAPGAGSGPGV